MSWEKVGAWVSENAGTGAALVGSLLTGNVPSAVAAGVALVSSATGKAHPTDVLIALKQDPATVVRLKELALQEEKAIRQHIETMTRLKLDDAQAQHEQTQKTIQAGDKAEDWFVRRTRPAQSWLSLCAALYYALGRGNPDAYILSLLLALPWTYAGLRQIGKGIEVGALKQGIMNVTRKS